MMTIYISRILGLGVTILICSDVYNVSDVHFYVIWYCYPFELSQSEPNDCNLFDRSGRLRLHKKKQRTVC